MDPERVGEPGRLLERSVLARAGARALVAGAVGALAGAPGALALGLAGADLLMAPALVVGLLGGLAAQVLQVTNDRAAGLGAGVLLFTLAFVLVNVAGLLAHVLGLIAGSLAGGARGSAGDGLQDVSRA